MNDEEEEENVVVEGVDVSVELVSSLGYNFL